MLKKIMDCIPEEDMTLSVNDSVICASDDVKNILVKRYGLRTYVGTELFTDDPKVLFLSDWQLFCRKNSKSIDSIWESLNAEYSPIENYDRTEVTTTLNNENNTTEYLGSVESVKSGSVESVKSGREINSNGNGITSTNYVTGYNDGGFVEDSKNVTTGNTETSYDNLKDVSTYNNLKDTNNFTNRKDVDTIKQDNTINSRIHGNIGVTTNQQMITQELELRKQSAIDCIIKSFVDEVSIMI